MTEVVLCVQIKKAKEQLEKAAKAAAAKKEREMVKCLTHSTIVPQISLPLSLSLSLSLSLVPPQCSGQEGGEGRSSADIKWEAEEEDEETGEKGEGMSTANMKILCSPTIFIQVLVCYPHFTFTEVASFSVCFNPCVIMFSAGLETAEKAGPFPVRWQ